MCAMIQKFLMFLLGFAIPLPFPASSSCDFFRVALLFGLLYIKLPILAIKFKIFHAAAERVLPPQSILDYPNPIRSDRTAKRDLSSNKPLLKSFQRPTSIYSFLAAFGLHRNANSRKTSSYVGRSRRSNDNNFLPFFSTDMSYVH